MSGETASAASSAPSQNTDKVVLKIGTTDDPDTLSPYTALDTLSWEIFCLNYDSLFGVGNGHGADPGSGKRVSHTAERRHLGRRQDLDHPHEAQPQVVGRPAADGRRRGLELQLQHREPHESSTTARCRRVEARRGRRSDDGAHHLLASPKADLETASTSPSCPSTSGARCRPKAVAVQPHRTTRRSSAADRSTSSECKKGKYVLRMEPQPLLLGQGHRPSTSIILRRPTRTPTRWRSDLRAGQSIDAAWGHPRRLSSRTLGSDPGIRGASPINLLQLGVPEPQLLRRARPPWAAPVLQAIRHFRQRLELCGRPPGAAAISPTGGRATPGTDHPAAEDVDQTPTITGSRPPARLYTLRPGQGWPVA